MKHIKNTSSRWYWYFTGMNEYKRIKFPENFEEFLEKHFLKIIVYVYF